MSVRDFVDFLVKQIVDEEFYEIVMFEDNDNVQIKVLVDKDKVARLIGKSGRLAKSIRTIVKAAAQNSDKRYDLYIEER
ncbi:MAG: KH domain-containing protein [Clostridia bacterium]|nr:KH domain-containing protein [Clostridia bacterium]MBO7177861.1 KH domain-containing protein [Clostridia bacterium]